MRRYHKHKKEPEVKYVIEKIPPPPPEGLVRPGPGCANTNVDIDDDACDDEQRGFEHFAHIRNMRLLKNCTDSHLI